MKKVECEHCKCEVPPNVYSRNHGDKCPYKDAPEGFKTCKCCNEFVLITSFALVTVNTYDGRNGTCNSCLGKKYYTPRRDDVKKQAVGE